MTIGGVFPRSLYLIPSDNGVSTTSLSLDPSVIHYSNLLNSDDCQYLIQAAAPHLQPARVYADRSGGRTQSDARTCSEAVLVGCHRTTRIKQIERVLAAAAQIDLERAHPIQILRYSIGQLHVAHYDAFDEQKLDKKIWRDTGQRITTLVTFLSDVMIGGDLIFPYLKLRIRPTRGSAVMFDNCDATKQPHKASMHGSLPVEEGTKWVAVVFFYERPFKRAFSSL